MQFKNPEHEWLIDVVIVKDNDHVFLGTAKAMDLEPALPKCAHRAEPPPVLLV